MRIRMGMYYTGITEDEYPFVFVPQEVWVIENNVIMLKGRVTFLYTWSKRTDTQEGMLIDAKDLIYGYNSEGAALRGAVYIERWYALYRGMVQDNSTIWGKLPTYTEADAFPQMPITIEEIPC